MLGFSLGAICASLGIIMIELLLVIKELKRINGR